MSLGRSSFYTKSRNISVLSCPFVLGIMSHLATEFLNAWLRFPLKSFSVRQVLISWKSGKDVLWKWVCYISADTYYPSNTSGWTYHCIWPLFLYHISLPVALSTFPQPVFDYLDITLWPFPTLVSLPCLFFFCLIDRLRLQSSKQLLLMSFFFF